MKARTCRNVGAYGTVIAGLCCLGALGFLLALSGAAAAIAYVNKYGDFVFLPAYGLFAALLVYGMHKIKRNWIAHTVTAVTVLFGIYVSLSFTGAALTLAGVVIGIIIVKSVKK